VVTKKNIFLGAILLLVVFVVAINFDKFTGQTVRRDGKVTEITVFPKEIESGEKIYVDIKPGDFGAELEIHIRREGQSYSIARWEDKSQGFSRYKKEYPLTTSYKTWGSWEEGEYFIKVEDIGTEEFVEDNFFIVAG